MTMDSLAEEMGISKRTIYERFKDKDTLLMEVITYYKNLTQQESLKLIDQSDNAIEALFRIIKMTVGQMQRMSPAFFHDFKKYHTRVYKQFSEPGDIRDYSITLNLLETGIRQEVFRNDIHIDIVNRTLHELFDFFSPGSKTDSSNAMMAITTNNSIRVNAFFFIDLTCIPSVKNIIQIKYHPNKITIFTKTSFNYTAFAGSTG